MNRIREIREAAGIRQSDLYRKLKWGQSRIANYESGERTPSLSDARLIVSALNDLGASCDLAQAFPEPDQSAA
ncbi:MULTISPECIES: helix-turn-helix transcriptional regulator [Pseudomonas]|uniref:Transcriptional regulator n=1 Tax=Pseudomonas cedrina TaxID=651740 RepID=A0A2S9E2F8_PSECE|nr:MULTISPECIES: helix-turn-helix transcriptional regulator [Pseudomonas]AVJ20983.1 transcriptional regulator [Pseudomonas sp. MYb193]PRC09021.1 transcriptional regulator [Pseudomonas cedrina]